MERINEIPDFVVEKLIKAYSEDELVLVVEKAVRIFGDGIAALGIPPEIEKIKSLQAKLLKKPENLQPEKFSDEELKPAIDRVYKIFGGVISDISDSPDGPWVKLWDHTGENGWHTITEEEARTGLLHISSGVTLRTQKTAGWNERIMIQPCLLAAQFYHVLTESLIPNMLDALIMYAFVHRIGYQIWFTRLNEMKAI